MPEFRKLLVLSTSHVSDETRLILDQTRISEWPVLGFQGVYGWVIYAHDDDLPEIPRDLWGVCEYARKNGCDYIQFDADADIIDDLPTYEW